jgi:hypothetical protein
MPVEPCADGKRIGLDVIGARDCLRYGIELIDEFGMVPRDLLLPDPGQQHDLAAVRVGDGRRTGLLARHFGAGCRTARTSGVEAAAGFE